MPSLATISFPSPPPSTSAADYLATEFHSGLWRTLSCSVVEHIEAADAGTVSRALTNALAKDRVWHDVLGKHASGKLVSDLMRSEVQHAISHAPDDAFVHTSRDRRCVAVWRRRRRGGGSGGTRIFRHMARRWPLREALRALHVLRALELSQPSHPHMHLQIFGAVDDASGDVVLREMTARLDREGWPAYVVASGKKDTHMFETHGFQVVRASIKGLPRGAPTMVGMWRNPQEGHFSVEQFERRESRAVRVKRALSIL
eukprot:IDg13646t1